MNNCGISRWDDPNEINARLKALTSQPIWEVTDEYYNNVILKYFDEKCKASKAVYEESKEYIPGGDDHMRVLTPFPERTDMCARCASDTPWLRSIRRRDWEITRRS